MYEVEIVGLSKQLAKLKDYDAIADEENMRAMNQSVQTLVGAIRPLTPIYRGRLRQSITSEIIHESVGSITGRVGSSLKSEIYPSVMEFGRTAGAKMPPPAALERWAHLKLGTVEGSGISFVIARSIARKGIKGRFFMKRGFEAVQGRLTDYFKQAMDRIINRLAVR